MRWTCGAGIVSGDEGRYPDDLAMELRRFELLVYIDNDGREQIAYQWSGEEVTGMAAVGYLEAAKLGMYHDQLHGFE